MKYHDDDPIQRALAQARQALAEGKIPPVVLHVFLGAIGLLVIIGLYTCFYTVQPEGKAVLKRFGKVISVRDPGLHFKLPFGIDRVYFVPTERVLKEEFGFRTIQTGQRSKYGKTREHAKESLMLTGDLNVIEVEWIVQYKIGDPDKWLHQVRNQRETIRMVAESVMRRIVGNRIGSQVLTTGRVEVAEEAHQEMQKIIDMYEMGVRINTVKMQDVTPPDAVKPAFNEVNEARQQRERLINEAEKRRNELIPKIQGEAQRIISEAEGYRSERINRAKGEAERFKSIYAEYRQAPEVTRRRMYLERIEEVMAKTGKVYVMEGSQMMPIPLLNLGGEAPVKSDR